MTDKERAWSMLSCICPEGWSDSDAEVVTLAIREAVAAERAEILKAVNKHRRKTYCDYDDGYMNAVEDIAEAIRARKP
jgi:hypothetical protein